jgi:ADP-ribose pyrophosphatase
VHRGRVFDLYADRLATPGGATVRMEVVRHPGAAAIVAVDDDGCVLLLHQYRYALDRRIWEIPAGTMEPGESPMACARRELSEEAGVAAGRWEALGELTPLPGYSDEILHLFRAGGLAPTPRRLDEDEFADVHRFPLDRALHMVRTGEITDGKTVAGLFLLRERIGDGEEGSPGGQRSG